MGKQQELTGNEFLKKTTEQLRWKKVQLVNESLLNGSELSREELEAIFEKCVEEELQAIAFPLQMAEDVAEGFSYYLAKEEGGK